MLLHCFINIIREIENQKQKCFKKNEEKEIMKKTNFLLVMTLSILLCAPTIAATVKGQLQVPTYLMVTAEPNPVGVGQTVYISLFFTKPIPAEGGLQRYEKLTLNLVKPDGTNQTFGPYVADTTGGVGGIEFTPSVTGNYTVQSFFPGQTLANGIVVLPSISTPVQFTVQEETIRSYNSPPLPSEYWSRPIYSTNFAWAQLGGNWWGLGKPSFTDTGGYDATGSNFNPYSQAPNSAHIMWTKPTAFGGQPGLPVSGDQESQYTSTSILYRQFEPIILNGIIFYKLYPNTPTTYSSIETPGWAAVDIRTGETLWKLNTKETLVFAMVLQFHTMQEYGTQAWLVSAANSSTWTLRDPMTGYAIANITGVPSVTASGLVDGNDDNSQGSVLIPAISSGNLTLWNSTLCLQGPVNVMGVGGGTGSTIRPSGNINYSRGIQYSVPVVNTLNNNPISLSIAARTPEAILVRSAPTVLTQASSGYAIEAAYETNTGKLLWGPVNRTVPLYGDMSLLAAGEGVFVTHNKDTNEAYGFSLLNGQQLWGPVKLPGNALSTLSRGGAIAYGNCYIWDYGGYANAINLKTGAINWTYVPRSAGYDTPYGIYPIWHFGSHSIADGKLFLSESRMYDPPLFPNGRKLALNVSDGSLVWSVMGFYGREPSAIADGYLVGWNSYDCQIYTFGKGPTSTTVNTLPGVTVEGSSVVINGFVKDESEGTKDSDRTARFPNGVPVVSEESMASWMEYVYMQQIKPTNATGVPVTLSVIDANGNYRTIGTTTTNIDGFYTLNWTPDIPGQYVVYATFVGSESYWPSHAVTSFAVDPAPATPTPQPTQLASMADQYFVPAIAGLFVFVAIIGVVIILVLRKRP